MWRVPGGLHASVGCLSRSELLLSKKSSPDGVVDRGVWSQSKEIGHAGSILGDQRQRLGAARFGFGSSLQEHASEPVFQRVNDREVTVLLLGVRMSGVSQSSSLSN